MFGDLKAFEKALCEVFDISSILLIKIKTKKKTLQGCALEEPRSYRQLNLAFGRLEKLTFSCKFKC